jgi:hypothetical protein
MDARGQKIGQIAKMKKNSESIAHIHDYTKFG